MPVLGNRSNRVLFIILAAVFLRVAIVFIIPAWQSPDEYPHYWVTEQISLTGILPVSEPVFPEYESYQPPLYYVATAGIMKLLSLEETPFSETPLPPSVTLIVLRLFSVLLSVVALWLCWCLIRKIPGLDDSDQLYGFAFLAILPTFAGIGATVNNDILVIILSVAALCLVTGNDIKSSRAFWGGILAGLAVLSKLSGLIILPVALYLLVNRYQTRTVSRVRLTSIFFLGLLPGLVLLLIRNLTMYDSVLAVNPGLAVQPEATIRALATSARNLSWSFWLAFGRVYQIHPGPVVYIFTALPLFLLSIYGWFGKRRDNHLLVLLIIAIIPGIIASIAYTVSYPYEFMTSWGKNLYPVLPFIASFLVYGWRRIFGTPKNIIPALALFLMILGNLWAIYQLWNM